MRNPQFLLFAAGVSFGLDQAGALCLHPPLSGARIADAVRPYKDELTRLASNFSGRVFASFAYTASKTVEQHGPHAVLRDPTFAVVQAKFLLPDGSLQTWLPGTPPPGWVSAAADVEVVAHDAHDFLPLLWQELEWPPPKLWVDVAALCRVAGLRGPPSRVAQELYDVPDSLRQAFDFLDEPKNRLTSLPIQVGELLFISTAFALLSKVDKTLRSSGEYRARQVHRAVNSRGFLVDLNLARAGLELVRDLRGFRARTHNADHAKDGLAVLGLEALDVRRKTLEQLLKAEDLPDSARSLIEDRLLDTSTIGQKLTSALQHADEAGRLKDAFAYMSARTGRFSGRGFNPHNLVRGPSLSPEEYDEMLRNVRNRDTSGTIAQSQRLGLEPTTLLACLPRAIICAEPGHQLLISDFRQIEPRVLFWLAEDQDTLSRLAGVDPYCEEAAQLLGVPVDEVSDAQRPLGKVSFLGAANGMGAEKTKLYGAAAGVDWSRLQITPNDVIQSWRDRHPLVAGQSVSNSSHRCGGLWNNYALAAHEALTFGFSRYVGPVGFENHDGSLYVHLPSSRMLVYRNAIFNPKKLLTFDFSLGQERLEVYPSKLTQNIVQAVARDVMVSALERVAAMDLDPVAHVHDEIVAVCPMTSLRDACFAMTRACEIRPAWAAELPLSVKLKVRSRYGQ